MTTTTRLFAACGLALSLTGPAKLPAQTAPAAHHLTFSNVAETIDADGRRVFVANVQGDLQGVLTLALVIGPGGVVTGGEWALNVSYIAFGPPSADGDGDASEALVQRGTIKGSVSGGTATLTADGIATDIHSIGLAVTGATLEFARVSAGSGNALGSSMNQQTASSGYLTLTF